MSGIRHRGLPVPGGSRPSIEISPRFMEGLVAGALIGAAIAGSTLWARIRRRRIRAPRAARESGTRDT